MNSYLDGVERIGPYELLCRTCRKQGLRVALFSSRQAADDVGTGIDTLAVYDGPMTRGAQLFAHASCYGVSEVDRVAEQLLEALVRHGHITVPR